MLFGTAVLDFSIDAETREHFDDWDALFECLPVSFPNLKRFYIDDSFDAYDSVDEYATCLKSYGPKIRRANLTLLDFELCSEVLEDIMNLELVVSSYLYEPEDIEHLAVLLRRSLKLRLEGSLINFDMRILFRHNSKISSIVCVRKSNQALHFFFDSRKPLLRTLECTITQAALNDNIRKRIAQGVVDLRNL